MNDEELQRTVDLLQVAEKTRDLPMLKRIYDDAMKALQEFNDREDEE